MGYIVANCKIVIVVIVLCDEHLGSLRCGRLRVLSHGPRGRTGRAHRRRGVTVHRHGLRYSHRHTGVSWSSKGNIVSKSMEHGDEPLCTAWREHYLKLEVQEQIHLPWARRKPSLR